MLRLLVLWADVCSVLPWQLLIAPIGLPSLNARLYELESKCFQKTPANVFCPCWPCWSIPVSGADLLPFLAPNRGLRAFACLRLCPRFVEIASVTLLYLSLWNMRVDFRGKAVESLVWRASSLASHLLPEFPWWRPHGGPLCRQPCLHLLLRWHVFPTAGLSWICFHCTSHRLGDSGVETEHIWWLFLAFQDSETFPVSLLTLLCCKIEAVLWWEGVEASRHIPGTVYLSAWQQHARICYSVLC